MYHGNCQIKSDQPRPTGFPLMTLSESNIKENKAVNSEYRPEVRDGDGEEGIEVLLLKFGDELAKRGDERRLRLEFMGGAKKVGGGE